MQPSDYIEAINNNPENRMYQQLYAEYLEDSGESHLAEGWRVLIEKGKRPKYWLPSKLHDYEGWNWLNCWNHEGVSDRLMECYHEQDESLIDAFPTFFDAMQAAAVAYVRFTYDPDYGKQVCPTCKGEKGHVVDTGGSNPDGSWIEDWASCEDCAGKGVVP